MAEVYLGRHITLNRPVAVKILHSYLSDDPTLNERFRAEAQAVAALRHPNIVQVFDYDTADDQPCIVIEAIDGPSLSDYLKRLHAGGGRLPLNTVSRLITAIASALDYAHARDIIHRDVKPANVMLRSEHGRPIPPPPDSLPDDAIPVLSDFGVARMINSAALTASGAITGTPMYMSPEQARGDKVDRRSDIYSLGIMLYEMLTGQAPFSGDTPATLIVKHLTEPPPPPRWLRGELPPAVEGVVLKSLAKEPDERYGTAGEMAADLARALGGASSATAVMPGAKRPAAKKRRAASRRNLFAFFGLAGCGVVALGLFAAAALALYVFRPTLFPGAGESAASAVLHFQNGTALNDKATLAAANLPPPPPGTQYEAWLIGESSELRLSLGVLDPTDGSALIVFTDSRARNLLADFDAVEITVEPSPDPNPLPSETVMLRGRIPAQPLAHIRHVLVAWGDTPGGVGYGAGLLRQAEILKATGEALLASFEAGDIEGVKRNAEAIVNLIEGSEGERFGDLDLDGATTNAGDGYGLLLNGAHQGYLQGTIDHARLAAGQSDATDSIKMHAEHVQISVRNASEWAVELRDLAVSIAQDGDVNADNFEGAVRAAVSLSARVRDGQDVNGNEQVEPIPGEGGALTAYQHAQYMADIEVTAP